MGSDLYLLSENYRFAFGFQSSDDHLIAIFFSQRH
jgi:hypothetical protein